MRTSSSLSGNTLRHKSLKKKSLKNEEWRKRDWGFTKICSFSLSPFVFLYFDGCIFFKDVLVYFLRV